MAVVTGKAIEYSEGKGAKLKKDSRDRTVKEGLLPQQPLVWDETMCVDGR